MGSYHVFPGVFPGVFLGVESLFRVGYYTRFQRRDMGR